MQELVFRLKVLLYSEDNLRYIVSCIFNCYEKKLYVKIEINDTMIQISFPNPAIIRSSKR